MPSHHAVKLVILGRDGVLNAYREDHVKAPEEWQPIPGALEAVARLNHAGWHTVVATNQAGIGRGMIDMASINAVVLLILPIWMFYPEQPTEASVEHDRILNEIARTASRQRV